MKKYFELQDRRLNRKIEEIGIPPLLGYLLAILVFVGFSFLLYSKTELGAYYYGISALYFVLKLSEKNRNDFLKTIFSTKVYKIIRSVENLIIAVPFVVFLIFKQSILVAGALFFLSVLLSFISFNNTSGITIPTPFSKNPFEFNIGFRKTFFVFPVAYFLTFQSIFVGNFNLGLFSLLLIMMITLTYYLKPENEYFVWIFNLTPKEFLIKKLKTALFYFTLLATPVLIVLSISFPSEISILIVFLLLSYIYIITIIFAKYSAYPYEMNIPQGLILGISLMFPLILPGIIPLFYTKSIKQLKTILGND